MKFLVIQQKMIGDVLASTVICESLKHYFPHAQVYFVANENTLPVLKGNPFVDKVIVFKNENSKSRALLLRFLRALQKTRYYAIVDAYSKLESNLMTLFVAAEKKISKRKWYTRWIYTDTVVQDSKSDGYLPLSVSNRLMLLDPLVEQNSFVALPKIYLTAEEKNHAKESIAKAVPHTGNLIMIAILGSAPAKTYPANYMAKILDFITAQGNATLLFNYIPEQKEKALQIFNQCSKKTQESIVIDFYAPSLREFMGILSQCDMLIGNEGGAVNMAKALNIPTFAIFSPFIPKDSWSGSIYAHDVAVHLADYRPELIGTKTRKELLHESELLYPYLEPQLFEDRLLDFLSTNLTNQHYNQ